MIDKLLLVLIMIGASSAIYDQKKSNKIKINVSNEQLDRINDSLKDDIKGPIVREVMTQHLESMVPSEDSGDYILTFLFK